MLDAGSEAVEAANLLCSTEDALCCVIPALQNDETVLGSSTCIRSPRELNSFPLPTAPRCREQTLGPRLYVDCPAPQYYIQCSQTRHIFDHSLDCQHSSFEYLYLAFTNGSFFSLATKVSKRLVASDSANVCAF